MVHFHNNVCLQLTQWSCKSSFHVVFVHSNLFIQLSSIQWNMRIYKIIKYPLIKSKMDVYTKVKQSTTKRIVLYWMVLWYYLYLKYKENSIECRQYGSIQMKLDCKIVQMIVLSVLVQFHIFRNQFTGNSSIHQWKIEER